MHWINGVQQQAISIGDRSVQYGDGCFTTAWVVRGQIRLVEQHIARLRVAAERLLMPACDWLLLGAEMRQAVVSCTQGVLKVILSRGEGGRGYSTQAVLGPTRIMSLSDYPQHYHRWREQGIELAISPIALARNPLLAGIKHLNRLEQVMIRAHLDTTQAHEALVTDTGGAVVECCAANVFWRKGNQVYTPDLFYAGVEGIMRQKIISLLENAPEFRLNIVTEPPTALAQADEAIVCNALMPILPVRKIASWHYTSSQLFTFLYWHCL